MTTLPLRPPDVRLRNALAADVDGGAVTVLALAQAGCVVSGGWFQQHGVHGGPVTGTGSARDGHQPVEDVLLRAPRLLLVVGQRHDDPSP